MMDYHRCSSPAERKAGIEIKRGKQSALIVRETGANIEADRPTDQKGTHSAFPRESRANHDEESFWSPNLPSPTCLS